MDASMPDCPVLRPAPSPLNPKSAFLDITYLQPLFEGLQHQLQPVKHVASKQHVGSGGCQLAEGES